MVALKNIILRLGICSMLFAAGCLGADKNLKIQGELSFEMEGFAHRFSEYRGKNVMLVLMRTSDVVNQIYMMRLSSAYSFIKEEVVLVVLCIDPSEAGFVPYYQENENLPFPLGVAEPSVFQGTSKLGPIPGVPMTYFINQDGIIVKQIAGVIEVEDLRKLLERFFER